MADSAIEWTEKVWNPTSGCTRVSAGCDNCYAVKMTKRLAKIPLTAEKYGGLINVDASHFNGVVKCHKEELGKPRRWRKPRRIFVNSMSDLFHKDVPPMFIKDVFAVMQDSKHHTFQILTKRPDRMCDEVTRLYEFHGMEPLPNVWLGVSVENQQAAGERIPHLLRCPAAVRFLSCEPLLGEVRLRTGCYEMPGGGRCGTTLDGIHWVITGGESGPGARPCNIEHIRSIVGQCQAAGVPVYVKQLGAKPHGFAQWPDHEDNEGRGCELGKKKLSKKGGDPTEWPEDLRVRDMPASKA